MPPFIMTPEEIKSELERLEKLIGSSTDAMERITAIDRYGSICLNNRLPLNIEWAKEALKLSEELNYAEGIYGSATNCGYYYAIHNEFPESLEYFFKALEVSKARNHEEDYTITLGNIAANYDQMGEYEQGMRYVKEAIQLNEAANRKYLLMRNFGVLAGIYYVMEQYDKSKEYFEKASVIAKEENNPSALAMYVGNIGHVHHELKDFEKAIEHFSEALQLNESANVEMGVANNTGSLGKVYMDMKNYPKATEYLNRSVALNRKIDFKVSAASYLTCLGKVFSAEDNPERNEQRAEKYFLEAEEIAYSVEAKREQVEIDYELATFYKQNKIWEKFAYYFERYHLAEKELRSTEAIKAATGYEMQKKLAVEEAQRAATEKILHNILPLKIAERIKKGEEEIIERFENCSVLFADMVGFTKWSGKKDVNELGATLNKIFTLFDSLANEFGVEKIKTIGDAYMCVAGLPELCDDPAERMAKMALAMNEKIRAEYPDGEIKLRIGIHTGEVVAGVIGKNKYAYDLWGDTVNTASRMESHGVENKIQVSEEFKNALSHRMTDFAFKERGEIEVKGKGKMKTWFLIS